MHIQTHLMSGWCIANIVARTPRDRGLAMLAATLMDLDGLGILAGQRAYERYHHLLAHNALFILILAALLTIFSTHRLRALLLYLGLMHLHLVMDYFGSGPFWPIVYFWPFSHREWASSHAWAFDGWQNQAAGLAMLACTIFIAIYARRTPLESVMPSLDRQIVAWLRAPFARSQQEGTTDQHR